MPFRDNLHSRVVAWLKITLPLAAIGLLSAVFLVATREGPGGTAIPLQDLAQLASGRTVAGPVFSSVTDAGERVVMTAQTATPRGAGFDVVDATEVHGTLFKLDGGEINVRSDSGVFYGAESRTVLRGNVRIETASGYTLLTEELISAIDRTDVESTGPVFGEGPAGTIEAGRMVVKSQKVTDNAAEQVSVVFKDGVKVIYTPQNQ